MILFHRVSSTQQRKYPAGALDDLLLLERRIEEFNAVIKATASSHDAPQGEWSRGIGKNKIDLKADADGYFPGCEQGKATFAHVGGLRIKLATLAID